MRIKRILLLLICLTLLSGCGFHLRRTPCHLAATYPTVVLPFSGTHSLYQAVYHALTTQGITVLECPDETVCFPQIRIGSQSLVSQPLVYGADGELRRERLRLSVEFIVETDCARTICFATYRDRILNNRQHLGDNAEKILLEREMQQDIIQQFFRYLVD